MIPDMLCASSCVTVGSIIRGVEGVEEVLIESDDPPVASVSFDDEKTSVEAIMDALKREGYLPCG